MNEERYSQTVDYLYSLLPAYQKIGGSALKKNLDNIQALCEALGNPQTQFRSVLIAGTNGKGSVSSMLFSIMRAAGYSVGLYTSPHLLDFRERIRVNEAFITREEVISYVEKQQELIEKIRPSFFEFTVAMAFDYFAQKEIEWAMVEVGLGGRLDSTNILQQDLSLITNISLDHQHLLGNTLQEIAFEKAGIIKEGVPTLIGETQVETSGVFLQQAWKSQAPILFADRLWKAQWEERQIDANQFSVSSPPPHWEEKYSYSLDLNGDYQLKNLPVVMEACGQLRQMGVHISEKSIQRGLSQTRRYSGLRGRMEVLSKEPFILIDTGHNEAGVRAVWEQFEKIPAKRIHIVWGMVVDKEHNEILDILPENAEYYFVQPHLRRAYPSEKLREMGKSKGLKGSSYPSVQEGIHEMLKKVGPEDKVWIGGSTFVVAEALAFWEK